MNYMYELPYPPSANRLWRRGKGRIHRSGDYTTFLKNVEARVGIGPKLEGDLEVHIYVAPPDSRVRDIDNVVKPILDALVKAGVMLDDFQVRHFSVSRLDPERPYGKIGVLVERFPSITEESEL